MVRRPGHLPRLGRGLAQRGLRHLLRVHLARARTTAATRPTSSCSVDADAYLERGRAATTARSCAGNTTSRSTSSIATSTRRAAACCTCCATSSATPRSGARSRTTRASTRTARSRRATWRAPIEEATGRNLDVLLRSVDRGAGHPELEGRWEWDADRKVGTLRLEQKQPITRETPLFQFAARGAVRGRREGARRARSDRGGDARASSSACPTRPTQVIFDPGDVRAEDRSASRRTPRSGGGSSRRRGWRSTACAAARALGRAPDPASSRGARRGAGRRRLLGGARRGRARARRDPARRRARAR